MDVFGIGSGSTTLAQTLIIAYFCGFGGTMLLGANTIETIKTIEDEIVGPQMYSDNPEVLMIFLFAPSRGWPVSTTHDIFGAITGAGISAFGGSGVATMINIFYIILKDSQKSDIRKASVGIPISIAVGVGAAVFIWYFFFFLRPYLRRKIQDNEDLKWYHFFIIPFVSKREMATINPKEMFQLGMKAGKADTTTRSDLEDGQVRPSLISLEKKDKTFAQRLKSTVFAGLYHDINTTNENKNVDETHAHATKFDNDAERLFFWLKSSLPASHSLRTGQTMLLTLSALSSLSITFGA
ncbi:Na+/Pi symporter [Gamsiella multidivaricata]|nr:Na+/Pi symporter [Gamsiella multidivaricata]